MALTDEEVSEILAIIDESELDELTIETPSFSLHFNRNAGAPAPDRLATPAQAPTASPTPDGAQPAPAPPAPARPAAAAAAGAAQAGATTGAGVEIVAPMLGTFYRTESPAHPPFVEVGDRVEAATVVCLIEVMKLMNHIQAGVAGTVAEVLAQSGELVEFGQPLFRVAPGGE